MKLIFTTVLYFLIINTNFGQEAINSDIEKFPVFEDCKVDDQELPYCFENELKKKLKENYKKLEIAYDESYSDTVRFNVEIDRKGNFIPLATDSFNSRTFIAASRAISSLDKVEPALSSRNSRPTAFQFTVEFKIERPKARKSNAVNVEVSIGYEHFEDVVNTPF